MKWKDMLVVPIFILLWFPFFFVSVMFILPALLKIPTVALNCKFGAVVRYPNGTYAKGSSYENDYCRAVVASPYIAATLLSVGATFLLYRTKKSPLRKK